MAIKVEAYGTKQKKTCFGCGSMISFENDDIMKDDVGSYIECPVCGKRIKVSPIDRTTPTIKTPFRESELGKKAREALNDAESWDE